MKSFHQILLTTFFKLNMSPWHVISWMLWTLLLWDVIRLCFLSPKTFWKRTLLTYVIPFHRGNGSKKTKVALLNRHFKLNNNVDQERKLWLFYKQKGVLCERNELASHIGSATLIITRQQAKSRMTNAKRAVVSTSCWYTVRLTILYIKISSTYRVCEQVVMVPGKPSNYLYFQDQFT